MSDLPTTIADAPILLVGCGNMGGAMLRGWLADGRGDAVTVLTRTAARVPAGVRVATDPAGVAGPAPRILVLAVKPQSLGEVAPGLQPLAGPGTVILSALAAVDLATLRRHFPAVGPIVRSVPNLPCAIGEGATALAAEPALGADGRALVTALCAPLGLVEWLGHEALLDAATALAGCGPAFLFRFAAAAIAAGMAGGLGEAQARRLFARTLVGAGAMLASDDRPPAAMADAVASPGGVTRAGLDVLDRDDALARLVSETLTAAMARSAAMAATARDA